MLALSAPGFVIGSVLACAGFGRESPLDVLVEGGRVLVGRTLESANVGVRGDAIAYLGSGSPAAVRTISAAGMLVAPGFIDVNMVGVPDRAAEFRKLRDGTTTYLSAHGNSTRALRRPLCLNRGFTFEPDWAEDYISQSVEALGRGSYGVAASTEYLPADVTPERVDRLCKEIGARGALISLHTRYSSRERELEGVDEAIRCAEHGAHVQILHLNSTGGSFQPRAAVVRIENARKAGRWVEFDFYPFTYWKAMISGARFEGDWLERYGVSFSQVTWTPDPWRGLDAASFAGIQATHPGSHALVDSIPRATIDYLALETRAPIGTDTSPVSRTSHPRGASSFATYFRDYVNTGRVPVEDALYRFSSEVAERFGDVVPGLRSRGRIEIGAKADLIVLDPANFAPRATPQDPLRTSTGVRSALVGGKALLLEGRSRQLECRLAGKLLRGVVPPQ